MTIVHITIGDLPKRVQGITLYQGILVMLITHFTVGSSLKIGI